MSFGFIYLLITFFNNVKIALIFFICNLSILLTTIGFAYFSNLVLEGKT